MTEMIRGSWGLGALYLLILRPRFKSWFCIFCGNHKITWFSQKNVICNEMARYSCLLGSSPASSHVMTFHCNEMEPWRCLHHCAAPSPIPHPPQLVILDLARVCQMLATLPGESTLSSSQAAKWVPPPLPAGELCALGRDLQHSVWRLYCPPCWTLLIPAPSLALAAGLSQPDDPKPSPSSN